MVRWSERTTHEKLSLVVFVVFASLTLVFGAAWLQKSIVLPFYRPESAGRFKSADDLEKERVEKLKTIDTDGDGLTDYDELFIYRTSPYLEDSDSDTFNDGVEVSQGFDPNCPKGKTCGQQRVAGTTEQVQPGTPVPPAGSAASATETAQADAISAAIMATFGDTKDLTPEKIKAKLETMSSADLRAFLTKLGVPEAALQKTDDATLRKLLQETLEEVAAASGTATPPSP
jgi:hypothetical protein